MMRATCCLLIAALLAPTVALAEDQAPAPDYLRLSPEVLERIDSAQTKRAWSVPALLSGSLGLGSGLVLAVVARDDKYGEIAAVSSLLIGGALLALGLSLASSATTDLRLAAGLEESDRPAMEPAPARRQVFVR